LLKGTIVATSTKHNFRLTLVFSPAPTQTRHRAWVQQLRRARWVRPPTAWSPAEYGGEGRRRRRCDEEQWRGQSSSPGKPEEEDLVVARIGEEEEVPAMVEIGKRKGARVLGAGSCS